jgi:hypothetical protein
MWRMVVIALVMAPAAGIMFYRNPEIVADGPGECVPWVMLGVILMGILLPIVWTATRFKVTCSLVGERGAIRYTSIGRLGGKLTVEKILFENASALFVSGKRYKVGTVYQYKWVDAWGHIVCQLKGKFTSSIGMSPDDPSHFVTAAETAWSRFVLARADKELAAQGHLRFTLDRERYFLISPGVMEIHFGSQVRCEVRDIKSIKVNNGMFAIIHNDATWYSLKGRFLFSYASMPNARVFLFAVERFLPRSMWNGGSPELEQVDVPG